MPSLFPSLMTQPWQILAKNQDYLLASWGDIFAVVWFGDTTVEGVLHVHAAFTDFAVSNAGGKVLLTIVSRSASSPSSAARHELATFLTKAAVYLRCSAVIMEGTGFRAAAVRSVVTALNMLAKYPYPHRVCDLEDAIGMFAQELPRATGRPVSQSVLRVAVHALREQAGLMA
jgi:hypothetical protein